MYYYLEHDLDKNNEKKAPYPLFKEKREQYKKWFDENAERYYVVDILDNKKLLNIDWQLNDRLIIEMNQNG